MPHSFGYRARTRDMFCRPFRKSGVIKLSTYLTTYKRGDYVDIKANAAIHKGMPFKHYHGRTGIVFNITKRAVGVRVNKMVRAGRTIHPPPSTLRRGGGRRGHHAPSPRLPLCPAPPTLHHPAHPPPLSTLSR